MDIMSSDPPCKESNARFTMVPLKQSCFSRVQRCVCVNLSKPTCNQLQISMCAVSKLYTVHSGICNRMQVSLSLLHKALNSTNSRIF